MSSFSHLEFLPKILFLNGPKLCGKDTLAKQLCMANGRRREIKFSAPMKLAMDVLFYNGSPQDWNDDGFKQAYVPGFQVSNRDALIQMSEGWLKVQFAPDVMGRIALEKMVDYEFYSAGRDSYVISDGRFREEQDPIVDYFNPRDCAVVRIHRTGCGYAGDSGSYIDRDDVRAVDITNNGHPREMIGQLEDWLINEVFASSDQGSPVLPDPEVWNI